MARLQGSILLTGLPPRRGLIVTLCFFPVSSPTAAVPYNGDPPAEACDDCDNVFDQVDLHEETIATTFEHKFRAERAPGYYYVQLSAILFRTHGGKVLAQTERFFFGRRPVHVSSEPEGDVTLPVNWPTQPVEALHTYATVTPRQRPWWRLW